MALSAGTAYVDIQPNVGAGFQSALTAQMTPAGAVGGRALGAGLTAGLGIAVAGVGAAVAGVAGLASVGEDFDAAFDTIRAGTGATGDQLAGLQDSFKTVFASVPTDMGTAAAAVADLNTRLGHTGEPLEALAGQFIDLGRIADVDVSSAIEKSSRVFGDWGVAAEDQSSTLDLLFRTSQSTGIGFEDLSSKLVQFGAPLRQFGFSMTESAALLGKWEKEGVNTELVLGSMRIAMGNFARDGIPMRQGLEDTIAKMQELGPGAESTALAMDTFGARAGPDMAAAILEGRFAIDELVAGLEAGGDTISGVADETSDWRESFTELKNGAMAALEPLATQVFGALGGIFRWLADEVPPIIESLTPVFQGIGTVLGAVFTVISSVLSVVFDVLSGLIDFVVSVFTGDWSGAWDAVKGIFTGVWDTITGLVGRIPDIFRELPAKIWEFLSGLPARLLGWARDLIGRAVEGLGGAEGVLGVFRSLPGKIGGFLAGLPGQLLQVGKDMVSGIIRGLGNLGAKVFDSIKRAVSGAINRVKDFFGIGSPSRVFAAQIGAPLLEGIILPFDTGARRVAAAITSTVTAGADAAALAARQAITATDRPFTRPLAVTSGLAATGTDGAPGGVVVEAGGIVVNNPAPEPASTSIVRELRRADGAPGK